ncbi:mycofactocin-associated electron transfer flavoprotein alpha subunit [Labedaea rhizosphaerae]|uniref:Electron transfer flavoprotein alpha subunit apoprotein n=1 Tax=Labedaea rhizosphaerae TaxID=598644 RepID=A0A4R6S3X3_LABRH|nr:mycofactocin-associated electron transfer flavoprotein alpha subunit [Labedaea rhizosphaerae]TDP93983.1 electron transfer flavoprotein alpha subunit apoprotein [Labedaea rhizosphaerae]
MIGAPGRPLALLVVRDGEPPLGADEAVAEAAGAALVVGSGPSATGLVSARRLWLAETGSFAPGALAAALSRLTTCGPIILPASPDGRDLAPRLAAVLGRPLLANAVRVHDHGAEVTRWGGQVTVDLTAAGPFVATLVPGVRGSDPVGAPPAVEHVDIKVERGDDVEVLETLEADPATADLAEAPRILGAGAGLGSRGHTALLGKVAAALGASLGATRVVTDAGWAPYERQIGTTGVAVDPELYVAFGVSGAAQHLGGLGSPRAVVSVNTDPSCPMTAMADLGIVTDAPGLLDELAERLGVERD